MVRFGRNSIIQDILHVFFTCKFKKNRINTNLKIWRHIFSDAQGQLTPKPVADSDLNLNSSKLLCMSSLHAIMKRIQSKQLRKRGYSFFPIVSLWKFFLTRFAVHGQIWSNFKLIKALIMYVIVPCKYEQDPIKNSR